MILDLAMHFQHDPKGLTTTTTKYKTTQNLTQFINRLCKFKVHFHITWQTQGQR